MLLDNLAYAAGKEGDLVAMLDLDQQCLAIHRETGDRIKEAIMLMSLGLGWTCLGDLEQGRRDLDAALHMLRANGHRDMEGAALGGLSRLALWQGDETRALGLARSSLEIAVAAKARLGEMIAELRLGDAELSLGRLGDGMQAYTRARARALEIDSHYQFDACAGLARVALAEGNVSAALAAVQPVLDHVATGGKLAGLTDAPTRIELTCHQVLACAGDPHATQWLARAHTALMTEADAISDASLRKGYLHNVPHHREVVVAWSMRSTPAP
jgi:tetratricopeptide (TPR) repeat protein